MKSCYLVFVLLCCEVLTTPLDYKILNRSIRSPSIFKKKPLAHLLGGLGGSGGGYGGGNGGGYGGGNYVTNINNYGPNHHQSYNPHVTGGHEHGSGSFAGSAAIAGGHGSQAQSQSASFSFGPYAASFSQSQAQGGGKGGFDYSDY